MRQDDASRAPQGPIAPEAWIALVFSVAAVALGLSGALPDDEGQLTFLGARVVAHAPRAGVFFQKIHPAISAPLAPFAAAGWRAFLVAHVACAGAAVYLLGRAARSLAGDRAWLASLLLAASPMFFLSAATGQSNSTAVLYFTAALALSEGGSRARLLAGAIAGAGLWSRYEQAPYLLGLVAFDALWRRRWEMTAGAAATVALYVAAGAVHHGSALWLLSRPPVLLRETAPTTMTELALDRRQFGSLLAGLCLVSPFFAAPLVLPRAALASPIARALAALLGVSLAAQLALPQLGRLFNYDYTARYFVCHLPAMALLLSAAARAPSPAPQRVFVIAVVGVALLAWIPEGSYTLPMTLLLAAPVALGLARRGARLVAVGALAGGALALAADGRRHTSALPMAGLAEAVAHVARAGGDAPVYTNVHQFRSVAERAGVRRRVRFLVGYDMVIELAAELGGRPSAHSAAIFGAITPQLYGEAMWPCACPHVISSGSLLVIGEARRMAYLYDVARWREGAERVFARGEVEVWRTREALTLPCVPRPAWMDERAFRMPCAAP